MVHYIPILTTIISAIFFLRLLRHYRSRPEATYLLWWTIGIFAYGFGTCTESINTLMGWSAINTKVWYIAGALLGGFPLAQGTVYLLFRKKIAHITTMIFVGIIVIASVCVILSPIILPPDFDDRLSGSVFAWQWVRAFSPVINLYAFIFLFGGALWSAYKYYKLGRTHTRFLGNVFISVGALLPGIGGAMTRMGHVEVLYVTELIGILCIFFGYHIMRKDRVLSIHKNQNLIFSASKG